MTVKELKEELSKYPDDYDIMTKKTDIGTVGCVHSTRKDSYIFVGMNIPCVLLTDEFVKATPYNTEKE